MAKLMLGTLKSTSPPRGPGLGRERGRGRSLWLAAGREERNPSGSPWVLSLSLTRPSSALSWAVSGEFTIGVQAVGTPASVLHVSALWALFPPQAYSLISCPEEGNGRSSFVKAFPEEARR